MDYIKSFYQFFKYPIKTWVFSILLGAVMYSLYTINTPKPHNLVADFHIGFLLYTLSMGLSSIKLFSIFCLSYFILLKYRIGIIWRKLAFIAGLSLIGIYQSMTNERAFQFDIHGNYLYPFFESTMTVFWLIYGSVSIFFILILKDKNTLEKNKLL
jgi:hypothetical protein